MSATSLSTDPVMGADVFGTARLRRGVLDAWAASPARFREDANAEEELALGGYRDRLVVELAQNAADAAARAAVPGRLRLVHRDGVLVAANTGAPLDAEGAESLSTLRASAKRDSEADVTVGRFGVGFAAVLAVSDEPAVVSRTGAVRWSLDEALELARGAADSNPGLAEELRRRKGHVPLLRLPFPLDLPFSSAGASESRTPVTPDEPAPKATDPTAPRQRIPTAVTNLPEGYDTAVVLPLRDVAAEELTGRLLAGIDDALLLALPGLTEIVVETADGVRTLVRAEEGPYTRIEESAPGGDAAAVRRWRTATAGGRADDALLADRPLEERARPGWTVTWAVPVGPDGAPVQPGTAPFVHAPTPTDEPHGLPALLIATLPLDSSRRRVAPGPLADFLIGEAARTYAELLRDWHPVGPGTIGLVPGPLGRGEWDAELRHRILDLLPRVPFLPSATPLPDSEEQADEPYALRPADAEIVEGAGADTVAVLAELFPNLLTAGLERRPELRALGVGRVPLGEAIDRLAGTERPPAWWWRLYDSLAGVDPDRLTGLPVPLADGRTTLGPRQVLLPLPDSATLRDAPRLARLGLKVAHADAAHPLLEKLGATPATPRAVLTTPQVRAAVAASLDEDEPWDVAGPWDAYETPDDSSAHGGRLDDRDAPDTSGRRGPSHIGTGPLGAAGPLGGAALAEIVLDLVREAQLAPGDEPWLGALALPDEDGEPAPAGELVLPGSAFERVIRGGELAACDPELVDRWGEQPLTAVGVLADFTLVRATDVVLDPDELEPRDTDYAEPDDVGLLDAVDVWCEDLLDQLPPSPVPPVATELVAVRDLDLVDDDCWPQALAMLARPPLRDALTAPVRVLLPDGMTRTVRPYTAWWLRGHPVLDGRRPAGLRAAGSDPLLAGLYESADAGGLTDAEVLRALGVRTSAAALLDEPGGAAELLGRLADPDLPVGIGQLHGLYGELTAAGLDPETVNLPDALRAVVDGEVRVVDAAEALVADAPDLAPAAVGRPLLPVQPRAAGELAALLDVRRLSEAVPGAVTSQGGTERAVPDAVRALLRGAPASYVEHEELLVDGVEADWRWVDGTLHAATLEGVAAGLAWAAGQWPRRFETAALLEDPDRVHDLALERWYD